MSSYTLLNYIFLLTFLMTASMGASAQLQDPTYVGFSCSNRTSSNETYLSNIKKILTSFSNSPASLFSEGYHSLVKGQTNSMVFGMFLCRGDLSPEVCRDCVMFASSNTQSRCLRGKELLIQYDECMLGYSDRNILMDNVTRSTPTVITWNTQEIPVYRLDRFKDDIIFMMNESAEEAANSKEKRMAVHKSSFTSSETLYALVQCFPDLLPEECKSCLAQSMTEFNFSRAGGKVLFPSCNSRYEIYPFYNETFVATLPPSLSVLSPPLPLVTASSLPSLPAPPLPPGKERNSTVIILATCVPVTVFVLFLVAVLSALTNVANILGEDSQKWDSEAAMILKIATDVTNMLNFTPSRDFDHLVGMEAHIAKMSSLLCMESNEVRVVGMWGPAGIGKTTIARALYNRVSSDFQLSVFMENVKGSYSGNELDGYSSKLRLQEQFLSKLLTLKDMRINHLGVAEERLNSKKVFIVLDDVDKLEQLEALANEPRCFGAGSRIIVTTEHKELFKGHGVNYIYEVDFPSGDEALQIFSQSAFKQDYPPEGFMELAVEVTNVTNHLPLGLCVLGSSLRGKRKSEWTDELPSLKANLHGDIEKMLRVGYDSLGDDDKYKSIFLHIACLFDGEGEDRVIQLLDNRNCDIKYGLRVLVERALVYISSDKRVMMHHLLRKMGREIVRRQSAHEPGKRQFLIDAQEIYDVLADETGTGSLLGISFNMSETSELYLGERAFRGMHNLQILRFYKKWSDKTRLHLLEGLDCLPLPRKLKLLHWEACPMKQMPFQFRPECLVEINMKESKLRKLWEGVPMLRSLKKMDLSYSISLDELPDLSEAIFLNHLDLRNCESLVRLPFSIWKLGWLKFLHLHSCRNLEPLPANYALFSLSHLDTGSCSKFVDFPEISSSIERLNVSFTPIAAMPPSVENWGCLRKVEMIGCENITEFPRFSYTVTKLHLECTGIKEIPPWISDLYGLKVLSMAFCTELLEISPNICELGELKSLNFKGCYNVREFPAEIFQSFCIWHELELTLVGIGENSLPTYTPEETEDFPLRLYLSENDFVSFPDSVVKQVQYLCLRDCRELESLPDLPDSLSELHADNCVSLESLSQSSRSPHDPKLILSFINCSDLDEEAYELVIQQWACGYAVLPGSEVPDCFIHRASGSSLIFHLNPYLNPWNLYGSLRFKACVVLSPGDELDDVPFCSFQISCYVRGRHSTTVYEWPEIYVDRSNDPLLEDHLFILNSYFTLEGDNIPESEMLFDFRCLGMKVYPDTVSSNILECGVQLLEPCSCKYDGIAHPKVSTIPLKDDEGNNKSIAETGKTNKRARSSDAEEVEKTSKNLRVSN